MNVISICGQIGSGKSEVAKHLVNKHAFTDIALADPLKRFGRDVFGFTEEALWGGSNLRSLVPAAYVQDYIKAWDLAEAQLGTEGYDWVSEVLQQPVSSKAVEDGYASLLHQFFVMKELYPNLSPRIMLQHIGTAWGRAVNPDLWIKYTLHVCKKLLKEDGDTADYGYDRRHGLVLKNTKHHSLSPTAHGVVVSDLRFINEIEALHKVGILIKLIRPGTDDKALELGIRGHQSETDQKLVDVAVFNATVLNDGTLEDLYADIDLVINCLVGEG
jgi:hypothetical protein